MTDLAPSMRMSAIVNRSNHLDLADALLRLIEGANRDEAQPVVEPDGSRVPLGHGEANRLVPQSGIAEEITDDSSSHTTSLYLRQQGDHPELDVVGVLDDTEVPDVAPLELDDRVKVWPELIMHGGPFGCIIPSADLFNQGAEAGFVEPVAEFEVLGVRLAKRVWHSFPRYRLTYGVSRARTLRRLHADVMLRL